MDCSLPGSSVHGIFQTIVLEWVAISFSRGSSQPRARTQVSRIVDRHSTVWATREVRMKPEFLSLPTLQDSETSHTNIKVSRHEHCCKSQVLGLLGTVILFPLDFSNFSRLKKKNQPAILQLRASPVAQQSRMPAKAGDVGSIPGLGRLPGGGHGIPLQYSCLGNPMDRGAWQATVHRIPKTWTWLSYWTTTANSQLTTLWHSQVDSKGTQPYIYIYLFSASEIKTLAPWKKSYDKPRQHIKKQRYDFVNKGPSS